MLSVRYYWVIQLWYYPGILMKNKLKEENTNRNKLLFVLIFKLKCSPLKGEKYFCKSQGSKKRPVNGQCPDWLWIWPVKLSSCRSCWPVKIQSYWKWNKFKVPAVQLFQLLFIESLCIAELWYEILVTCN